MSRDARTRRTDIQRALDAANAAYSQATVLRQEAELQRGRATRAVAATRTLRATGEASDKDVEKAHRQVAKAEQAVADQLDKANAALDTVHEMERQLDALYAERFTEFVQEAEDATQAAHAAVLALEEPYGRARESWEAAVQAWAPLARAAHIGGVAPFPATELPELIRSGAVAARPSSVEVLPTD